MVTFILIRDVFINADPEENFTADYIQELFMQGRVPGTAHCPSESEIERLIHRLQLDLPVHQFVPVRKRLIEINITGSVHRSP